ncbi:MAG: hypothetical protein QM756_39950 [Polyangiaceae bacterium]
MKRSLSIGFLCLLASGGVAAPALAIDPEVMKQRLEKLKEAREKARAAARTNPSAQATTTATPPPPPPPPTATATATPTATASAVPTATVAPKASATPPAASASAAPLASASASAAPVVAGPPDLEQLRKSRPERKHREASGLRERWGDLAASEQAKSEMKQHAQRMAYLQRIRTLGESKNDSKFVESCDKLITAEERRNANAMNALRSGAKP